MSTDQLESAEFRLHVRNLLYEYSVSHYTSNYVTFTEDLVSEFIEDLKPVPLTDPYSFVISVDPFQTFSQIHSLSSLQPYDENAQTSNDAVSYVKNFLLSTQGPPKTDRLTWSDDTSYEPLPEPFIPALTRAARKQTPKLGKKAKPALPETYQKLLESQNIGPIHVEPAQEEKLIPEDILQLKLHIDPEELPAVKAILQSTADMMRPHKSYKNKYLDPAFLCGDSLASYELPEEVFMPIFPRSRLPRSGSGSTIGHLPGLESHSDIPSVVTKKVDVQDPDPDLYMQNLVTVDGWETIRSSPPSTPSARNSDSEDQLDQLFLRSSPNTDPPLVEEIEKSKIEEILIPRSRQIGGKSGITPHILAGKTLQSFLQPLLSQTKSEVGQARVDDPQPLRLSPTPSSLVGQPASELEEKDGGLSKVLSMEDAQHQDLNSELKALYTDHGLEDMIMKETIDDKQDMLWEVPHLPGPNIHPPNGLHVPKAFADFLIPPSDSKTRYNSSINTPKPPHRFLKKAKGRQSLGLELSWIPFTVDKRLPSVDELVGVVELFDGQSHTDGRHHEDSALAATEKLLKSLDLNPNFDGVNSPEAERNHSWSEETSSLYRPPDVLDDFKILLNRQERRRVAKLENRLDPEDDDMDCPDTDNANATKEDFSAPPIQDEQQGDSGGDIDDERVENERPVKRPRLDDHVVFDNAMPEEAQAPRPAIESFSSSHNDETFDPEHESPGFFLSTDDEEKENWPPLSSSSMFMDGLDEDYYEQNWSAGSQGQPMHLQSLYDESINNYHDLDQDMDIEEGGLSFEPLSFDSRYLASGAAPNSRTLNFGQERLAPAVMEAETEDFPMQISGGTTGDVDPNAIPGTEDVIPRANAPLVYEPTIASRSLGILAFAQLRSRKISEPMPVPMPDPPPVLPNPDPVARPDEGPHGAPQEMLDQDTIVLPETAFGIARSIHRYMASLDLIQKHGLVRHLRSEECSVELVERQTLGGVDIILDPSCAVIFLSVFTLPARCDVYVERVSQQSWNFSHLLVVFEAYPEHCARKSAKPKNSSELYAYTPPIVKAIKKFRRNINIAGACGTKRTGTKVQYAFADSVQEAALLTRWYGDLAEERDETSGLVWGEREWLGVDFLEDEEQCLAGINGMNHFAASMILSQISLQGFIDMLPEERVEACTGLIVDDALARCNADIENRCQAMAISSDLL